MNKFLCNLFAALLPTISMAQLNIQGNAKLNIQAGAYLVATGNIVSTSGITGTGRLVLKGSRQQQINFNGQTLPLIQIDNPAGVLLTGALRVASQLNFINGKLLCGNYALMIDHAATFSGAAAGRFIETNGTGEVRKFITANLSNSLIPLGKAAEYTPAYLTTSGTYASAYIRIRTVNTVHPNKPAAVSNYLNSYTAVGRVGVAGTVTVHAVYPNASIVGNEATYLPFFWTGTTWSKQGVSINTTNNQLTANITGSGGDMYAMNDFVPLTQNIVQALPEPANSTFYRETLYPNPAFASTTVSIHSADSKRADILVVDMKGVVVQRKSITLSPGYNLFHIDLSALAAGAYDIRLKSSDAQKTFRLLKK